MAYYLMGGQKVPFFKFGSDSDSGMAFLTILCFIILVGSLIILSSKYKQQEKQ